MGVNQHSAVFKVKVEKLTPLYEIGKLQCKECLRIMDLSQFKKDKTKIFGYQFICKACSYSKNIYKNVSNSSIYMQTKSESCQICGAIENTYFDHCHDSNKFRGWLCNNCNLALGHFKDDPLTLVKAAQYLINSTKERKAK